MSLLLLTGPPGAGKTTIAARLAAASPRGVHVRGDAFHAFLAHPVPPVRPESHRQNTTVLRATLRAARAYAQGGYDVLLEGIVGPWFLPLVAGELRDAGVAVDYAVLRVGLAAAVARATLRAETPAPEAVVRQMHAAFADLGPFERHAVPVAGEGPQQVAARLLRRRAQGALRLDLGGLAPG
jgi:predicted kinase